MKFSKKSLGQNFLIEKNVIKKILGLKNFKNRNIIEIGPGRGALTDEILKKKPKSLTVIEKDYELTKNLKAKYSKNKLIKVINADILNFNLEKIKKKKLIIIGNLPYNISSQILIKIIKEKNINNRFEDLIFMFQKELGERIIGKFPSKHYGRLSIIVKFKLQILKFFLVSANCFIPKPKVTSMVIHFKVFDNIQYKIKNISNLEKITNILFSNKRKMINKNIKKILNEDQIKKVSDLNVRSRAENIDPKIFYKITEIFETK